MNWSTYCPSTTSAADDFAATFVPAYNSVLAFTSTAASLNEGLSTGGVYTSHISAVMLLARACRGLAFVVQPQK